MKTTIFHTSILAALVAFGACAPAADAAAGTHLSAPQGISGGGHTLLESLNLASAPTGLTVHIGPANSTSAKRRDLGLLAARQSVALLCTGPIAPTTLTTQTLLYIYNLQEYITLAVDECIWWTTSTARAYFCATPCGGIGFGTTWLFNQLEIIFEDCVVDSGVSGEFYTTASPVYELGLVTSTTSFPQYYYYPCE